MNTSALDRVDVAGRLAFVVGVLNRRLRPPAEGLTHPSLSALASIARAESIRPGDLARTEGIAAPGMTRLIADLEQRGLIAREQDPDDGRSFLLRTTPQGDAAVITARHERAIRLAALLEHCDDTEMESLAQALAVLEAALSVKAVRL